MINGKKYAWEDITIILANHLSFSAQDISWDEEKEAEAIYGAGSKPLGYARGNWKGEGKITILIEEHQILLTYAKGTKGGIFGFKPFNIIVNYANDEEPPQTNKLLQCIFTKKSRKASQGEKKNVVELDYLILGDIKEGDIGNNPVSASGDY